MTDGTVGSEYLEAMSLVRDVGAYKDVMLRILNLNLRESVLDVGCGIGTDIERIARLVGKDGRAVGVDSNPDMIAHARQRSEALPALRFLEGDVTTLEFSDGTFDAVRADRLFQHLEDPWGALQEMIRVVKSQGRVIIYDSDWESLLISVDEPFEEITRKMLNFSCDTFAHGWIGRDLTWLFKKAGLTAIHTVPMVGIIEDYDLAHQIFRLEEMAQRAKDVGVASDEEISLWLEHLGARGRSGFFFSSITGFIVTGVKS